MPDFRAMYFRLAARVADAVEALAAARLGGDDDGLDRALEYLVAAQLEGEEAYAAAGEPAEDASDDEISAAEDPPRRPPEKRPGEIRAE